MNTYRRLRRAADTLPTVIPDALRAVAFTTRTERPDDETREDWAANWTEAVTIAGGRHTREGRGTVTAGEPLWVGEVWACPLHCGPSESARMVSGWALMSTEPRESVVGAFMEWEPGGPVTMHHL